MTEQKRLLIMACSQRKTSDPGQLSALERYNGPMFQVLHKYLHQNPTHAKNLDTYILSARFGLIQASQPIPSYDQKMTLQRAEELKLSVLNEFQQLWQNNAAYDELFINLGRNYWPALDGYEQVIPSTLKIKKSQGSLGKRQVELRDWLYHNLPEPQQPPVTNGTHKKARLRGLDIDLTPDQIFNLARAKLNENPKGAVNFQVWYVLIDEQQVSPKWLVSQLTGLAVGAFHSGEARRVLQQLGVEVKRV